MEKIRWGILSTARIGIEKVIPALQQCERGEVSAIASRDLGRARSVADRLQIPKAYGSYQELLDDADVQAIYNPLPNHLHVAWSTKALAAGKHVLCEKPIGLTAAEGRQLAECGQQHPTLKLMEAFMYRHQPRWRRAREIAQQGGIGKLRSIQTLFSYFNDAPDNIRNLADIGGGGLMDIGCYAISLARFVFGQEPARAIGVAEFDPRFQTDRLTSAILAFDGGTATFTCGTQLAPYQRVHIMGDGGRLELEMPFNTPPDRPTQMWHQHADGNVEELVFETCNQYTMQGDLFNQSILEDSPVPTPIDDAVDNMLVIEAIMRSVKSEQWETIA